MKNGPGDPIWGWKMLMQDMRGEQPEVMPVQQPQSGQVPQQISNIVNYPPNYTGKYHFVSTFTTIIMVLMLIVIGVLLWKFGVIHYLMQLMGL